MRWRISFGLALFPGLVMGCAGGTRRPPSLDDLLWRASFRDETLGTVRLRRTFERPTRLILFVTGDGGWNDDAIEVADTLAAERALVAAVDVSEWRAAAGTSGDSCADFARPLAALARRLRPELSAARDPVVVVGHSSGATIAFLALAQSSPGELGAAISLSFAPLLEYPVPPCTAPGVVARRRGGDFALEPVSRQLQRPWWVIQGADDRITPAVAARAFAERAGAARYVALDGQGHAFAGEAAWIPVVRDALASLAPEGRHGRHLLPAWGALR